MNKQVHLYFSGQVQGVGFRYTVENIARDLGLFGWVKNLPDGRVEAVAEGPQETLETMIERIEKYFERYIKNRQVNWQSATGEFKDFRIDFFWE